MSIVVAYLKNGIVYMGADTQTSSGNDIVRNLCDGYKISRLDNGIYIGVCGMMRAHQHLLATPEIFEVREGVKLDKKYIVRNVIPKLYDFLDKYKYLDEDSRKLASEISILVITEGKIFEIRSDFCVVERTSYAAIGAGCGLARGAFWFAQDADKPEEALLRVMRICAKHDSTVSAPYVLVNTSENEFKIEVD